MGLRSIESTLPPGFKFYPSDEELLCHYLYKKVTHERVSEGTLVEVDLHACEPWELPELAKLTANEWYFFSFRDRKYATGLRTNRATKSGYWKSTGKDRTVHDPSTHAIVGMRKTLVFYRGRAPNGIKTSWVMHEFRLEIPRFPPKEDWVLCRVFCKKKGEGMSYSMENEQDNTGCPSPNLESSTSMAGQSMQFYDQVGSTFTPTAPHNNEDHSSNSSLLNMALFQCSNFMELPQGVDSSAMMGMGSSGADDYGFLFDVGFEDHMGEGEMGNMGGMRFQGGKDKIYF